MRIFAAHRHAARRRDGALGRLRRFARDEGGTVTVEAVLWLPFFFSLLMIITDVSLAFYGKAQAFRVVQDVNRAVSVGRIATASSAKTILLNAVKELSPNAAADVVKNDQTVTTVVRMPSSDLVLFLGTVISYRFTGLTVTVGAQHYLEK